MLYCVLYKSSIDIEPLSSTLHGVTGSFIHHPSNVENYLIGHILFAYFTPLCKFLAQNSKYPLLQKFENFFDIRAIIT